MSGLTPTGFDILRLSEILTEIENSQRAAIGAQIQLGADSIIGQINAILAQRLALLWELMQEVYSSFDPDEATGVTLDNLAALTGVTRLPATPSTGVLTLTGTPATNVPAGSQYRVPNGPIFETTASVDVGGGGTVDVAIQAIETGPLQALAGTNTEIVTAIPGITSVSNADDVAQGTDTETDEDLRRRREQSLQATGTATDNAIQSRVSAITTVQDARVISNRDLITVDGIPGKSFLTVVWPTQLDDEPVWRAIYDTMPAGILAFGSITGTATDVFGNEQPVAYSVATIVEVHVLVELEVTSDFPVDGITQITAAVAGLSEDLQIGEDIAPFQISCAITALNLPGITNQTVFIREGATPTPSLPFLSSIEVDLDEIAQIDSGDVTVNTTP